MERKITLLRHLTLKKKKSLSFNDHFPKTCPQNNLVPLKMACKNLPSGSNVVSSTKLKEGRARDKVAMVTKTRQMKCPQLTMVTVPIPGPLPYLHVDGNPICTLPQGPWAACNAFSPRGAQEPERCGVAVLRRRRLLWLRRLLLLLLWLLLLPPLKEIKSVSTVFSRANSLKPRWDKIVCQL